MKQLFRQIGAVYLYGSIHIGLGAAAMTLMSFRLLHHWNTLDAAYLLSILAGTVTVYSLHRLQNLEYLSELDTSRKYKLLHLIQFPVRIITLVAAFGSAVLFFRLNWPLRLVLLTGGIITLMYSFPVFKSSLKLRELAMVKIFLIAGIWGLVTAAIPGYLSGRPPGHIAFVFFERALFVFALTLPFDIRDYIIDKKLAVETIPGVLGKNQSLWLAVFILVVMLSGMLLVALRTGIYEEKACFILMATNLITALLVWVSRYVQNDYYYTGVLDGMLIMQPLVLLILI